MAALSLLRFSFFQTGIKTPAASRTISALEATKWVWESKRTYESLHPYLALEQDSEDRRLAVFQFLFLACATCKTGIPAIEHTLLAELHEAEDVIRTTLRDHEYDHGFWQNIVMWHVAHEKRDGSVFLPAAGYTSRCFARMAAVETCLRDKISDAATEVGLAFTLKVLCKEIDVIGDMIWEQGFRTAMQFSWRRKNKQLDRGELVRLRDSLLYRSPHLAVQFVQPQIAAFES